MVDEFNEICKALSMALIDDFRGFLAEGTERIEVPEDKLHQQVACQEMSKIPNWKYISGIGQNPIVEYMRDKKAIYITKLPLDKENKQYQRTIGYLTDAYSELIEYKGIKQPLYKVLRNIALGMGYDADEYSLDKNSKSNVKDPVTITNYKANILIKKTKHFSPKRSLQNGDKPVFAPNGNLIGFMSNGKFVDKNHYGRYSSSYVSSDKNER